MTVELPPSELLLFAEEQTGHRFTFSAPAGGNVTMSEDSAQTWKLYGALARDQRPTKDERMVADAVSKLCMLAPEVLA